MLEKLKLEKNLRLVDSSKKAAEDKSEMGRTLALVEKRLADGTSENAIQDLGFLAHQYHARGEWDKSNAASRQMLRVAEGSTDTKFETTPLDVELLSDRKRHLREMSRRFRPYLYLSIFAALLFGAYCASFKIDRYWMVKAAPIFSPWMVRPLVDRAEFYFDSGDWVNAKSDCERIHAMDPNNSRAYAIEAAIAFEQGGYTSAQRLLAKVSPNDDWAMRLKYWLDFRTGDYRGAGLENFRAMKSGITKINSYDLLESGKAFALSNDYNAAIAATFKAQEIATNDEQRAQIFCDRAGYETFIGNLPEGIHDANKTLELVGKRDWYDTKSEAYLALGEAYLDMGDAEQALTNINESIKLGKVEGRKFYLRALALRALNRFRDAEIDMRAVNFYGIPGVEIP